MNTTMIINCKYNTEICTKKIHLLGEHNLCCCTHRFKHSAPQPAHKTISPGIFERSRDPIQSWTFCQWGASVMKLHMHTVEYKATDWLNWQHSSKMHDRHHTARKISQREGNSEREEEEEEEEEEGGWRGNKRTHDARKARKSHRETKESPHRNSNRRV